MKPIKSTIISYIYLVIFTWVGKTTRATPIIITINSCEGQMSGTKSPYPTVEKVTTTK